MPISVFLRSRLPSSAAPVAHIYIYCAARGRAFTFFHCNQDTQAFPPEHRFLVARLHAEYPARSWAESIGLLDRSRISRCSRPRTGRTGLAVSGANKQILLDWRSRSVGAGGPREHCAPREMSGCGRVGGPPMHACRCAWEGRQPDQGAIAALGHHVEPGMLEIVDIDQYFCSSTPPSFDVVAFEGYDVVAFKPLRPCVKAARPRNNEFGSPRARRRRAACGCWHRCQIDASKVSSIDTGNASASPGQSTPRWAILFPL